MGVGKTFFMKEPRDFLHKLDWDIEQLGRLDMVHDARPYAFQSINCAVANWSMADWVFDALSPEQRLALGLTEKVSSFKDYVKGKCPALEVCREIADASKHKHVDRKPSLTIGTPVIDVWEGPDGTLKLSFPIMDGGDRLDSQATMLQARQFWRDFLEEHGL